MTRKKARVKNLTTYAHAISREKDWYIEDYYPNANTEIITLLTDAEISIRKAAWLMEKQREAEKNGN